MIKPNKLESGMTVGLVSPASNAAEDEDILASIEFVKSLGFEAKAHRIYLLAINILPGRTSSELGI